MSRSKGVTLMITVLCFMWINGTSITRVLGQNLPKRPDDPTDPLINQGPKKEAIGRQVMVSTQVPTVTEAAVKVLREGGNAFDAFITAVLLQMVVEPHMVSHWGIMTGLIYDAEKGEYICFDGIGERPLASRSDKGDPRKVAIGGTVKALGDIWKRYGTQPWTSYFGPAINAAVEGVLVTPYMYTGDWAKKFVEESNKLGGRVSLEDLAEYDVLWREPLRFTYKGYEIVSEAPPIYGGFIVGYNLNILENFDLKKMGHFSESPEALEIMVRTADRVFSEVSRLIDLVTLNNYL